MRARAFRTPFVGLAIAGIVTGCFYTVYSARAAVQPYLGVRLEARAPEAADSGLTIVDVTAGGPADQAGLQKGDRIIMVGGKAMRTYIDLRTLLAGCVPGDALDVKLLRDGTERTARITLGTSPRYPVAVVQPPSAYLGVLSETLTPEFGRQLGVKAERGVVVTHVLLGSPAAAAGLKRDDVITQVGTALVGNQDELRAAIHKAGAGTEVTLNVSRAGQELNVSARLQSTPADLELPRLLPEPQNGQGRLMGPRSERLPALEKRVQELENRVRALEQRRAG
jgi:S1-C subfamily serine protease